MAYWTVPWLKSVYNIYTGVSVQRPERGAQLLGGDVTVTVLEPHCHYCHKYVVWKYLVKQTEHFLRPCQLKVSMISVKKAFIFYFCQPCHRPWCRQSVESVQCDVRPGQGWSGDSCRQSGRWREWSWWQTDLLPRKHAAAGDKCSK